MPDISVRVNRTLKQDIETAARMEGRSVSNFMAVVAKREVERIMEWELKETK